MKKVGKLLSTMFTVGFIAAVTATPVDVAAYTDYDYVGDSSSFTSEWERTRTYKVNSKIIGYMVYGFDIDWINEHYVCTKATDCYSKAMVKRSGYETTFSEGAQKEKDQYSKIEVAHKTYYVYYKTEFSASYSGVTYSTGSSSVKD